MPTVKHHKTICGVAFHPREWALSQFCPKTLVTELVVSPKNVNGQAEAHKF